MTVPASYVQAVLICPDPGVIWIIDAIKEGKTDENMGNTESD
jgi:hypothetical protein